MNDKINELLEESKQLNEQLNEKKALKKRELEEQLSALLNEVVKTFPTLQKLCEIKKTLKYSNNINSEDSQSYGFELSDNCCELNFNNELYLTIDFDQTEFEDLTKFIEFTNKSFNFEILSYEDVTIQEKIDLCECYLNHFDSIINEFYEILVERYNERKELL